MIGQEKFAYKDIAIVPAVISDIEHRAECEVDIKNLPLLTAPMDSVVNQANFEQWKECGITPILPRTTDNPLEYRLSLKDDWVALSLKEFEEHWKDCGNKVLIDMANGHVARLYKIVKEATSKRPELQVMVGNIANPETYTMAYNSAAWGIRLGVGGGFGCFVEGTEILTNEGYKNIEDIVVGDLVVTHKGNLKKVLGITSYEDSSEKLKINKEIICTPNHKFYVTNERRVFWLEAEKLDPKVHKLIKKDNIFTEIKSVEKITSSEVVYDLQVEDDHSYIANDYIVHNCITSSQTAIHYPMASLVDETYEIKKKLAGRGPKIIADGGVRGFSDAIKALALGSDYVMIGSVFTSMIESAGKTYITFDTDLKFEEISDSEVKELEYKDGKFYKDGKPVKVEKLYYGMASMLGQIAMNGKKTKTAEGIIKRVPVKYTMKGWTENFVDYLRSAMSYTGSHNLDEFKESKKIVLSQAAQESINK